MGFMRLTDREVLSYRLSGSEREVSIILVPSEPSPLCRIIIKRLVSIGGRDRSLCLAKTRWSGLLDFSRPFFQGVPEYSGLEYLMETNDGYEL